MANKTEGDVLSFSPPSQRFVEEFIKPFLKYFTPEIFGMENINPQRPTMFVLNHTVFGVTDGSLFMSEIYKRYDLFPRCLVDDMHFNTPIWKDVVKKIGFVKGSRENCAKLMEAKQFLVVYPGGGRETFKRKGEAYKLTWKKRTGFARMAIEYGYDIIPVAQIGGDDAYTILADANDIMNSFVGRLFKEGSTLHKIVKGGDYIPPIVKGLAFTPFPKPVKLYLKVGEPISTKRFEGMHEDEEIQWQLRTETELAMNKMFIELMEYRRNDPKRGFLRDLLVKI